VETSSNIGTYNWYFEGKGRFPFLHSIWMRLTGKKPFKQILWHITVCIVLHNFLVEKREDKINEVPDNLSEIDVDNELTNNSPAAN
jgi:hypothetical protein